MNEIVPVAPDAIELDVSTMSTAELRTALHGAIGITAAAIRRVATIWTELERRGEDLSDIRFALAAYMRPVATGALLSDAVAMLAGRRRVLDALATLPINEQQRLIDGEPVEIATSDGTVKKSLSHMTFPEIARLIQSGTLLNVNEQQLAIKRSKKFAAPHRGRPPRIIIDSERAEVRIGTTSVKLETLLAALRAAGIN